jgi:PhzF family phenazine biosynthesis protein
MAGPQQIQIYQYNAFASRPFAGNPAGVVTDASGLDDEAMQNIAQQMNLAETAFLVPPSSGAADVRLRWFTPAMEVELCGHATIAAFTAAAEHGVYSVSDDEERVLRVETLSGILRIRIARTPAGPQVGMQIPVPSFARLEIDREAYAKTWGVGLNDLAGEWTAHSGIDYWYVPVRDREALRKLTLNAEQLTAFSRKAGFVFYTADTVDSDSDWLLRFFAPFHGVPEDIVTGSAQGPMGVVHLGLTDGGDENGWTELMGEQGDLLGRPGRVKVRVLREAGVVTDVEIAGGAIPMLEGRVFLK